MSEKKGIRVFEFREGLTHEEASLAEHMETKSHGSFFTAFWTAVIAADSYNLLRLKMGFPDHIAAWERYMREGHFWRK